MRRKWLAVLSALLLLCTLAFAQAGDVLVDGEFAMTDEISVEWGWDYFETDEVALYLHAFGELPPNYLTKDEARDLGWVSSKGNLWDIGEGFVIGGDTFGNREGLLPDAKGRKWYECDVNYFGGYREAERLVFATDGLIYYTGDHYETFELLYDGWYDEDFLYGAEYLEYEDADDYAGNYSSGGWWNWGW